MSSFDNFLASANNQTLYKQAVAGLTVEVVDANLVPTVRVVGAGKTSSFPLEKLGLYWSDGTEKFYSEASDEEVKASELNDLAVEAHLFGQHQEGK